MAKIFEISIDGGRTPVPDAKRMSHVVGGEKFWFAVHESIDFPGELTVSHWDSGLRVCSIPLHDRIKARGKGDKAHAKEHLDKVFAVHGVDRVKDKLTRATQTKGAQE